MKPHGSYSGCAVVLVKNGLPIRYYVDNFGFFVSRGEIVFGETRFTHR